ncbi:MAG: hypothetical protein HYV92_09210 [Candidatus Rokubacteria bacterium]|nr:hypothetical protein [Candidatus Rokubacteria bacterium]
MKINRHLVWDYPADIPEDDEAFRRWYVARVLTRGGIDDVRAVGLETIREYLPQIVIPRRVREFWERFFGLATADGDPQRGTTLGH